MKQIKYIIVCLMTIVVAACGGDGGGGTSPVNPVDPDGRTYNQSVTLSALDAGQTVTLNNLNTSIEGISGGATWLTVLKESYTSGSPRVRLTATDNTNGSTATTPRSCTVTITAASGDRVLLNVTQEGYTPKTGIDDSHDIPTDQPAYGRAAGGLD